CPGGGLRHCADHHTAACERKHSAQCIASLHACIGEGTSAVAGCIQHSWERTDQTSVHWCPAPKHVRATRVAPPSSGVRAPMAVCPSIPSSFERLANWSTGGSRALDHPRSAMATQLVQ